MPRAPSDKMIEAEKLFNDGLTMVEIAERLGVSDSTVRSWKNRYGWGNKLKKNKCNVAKKDSKKNATLQKKSKGGQQRNKNAQKHGAYSKVYWDTLDKEEQILINNMDDKEEQQLIMQLQMFSVREHRLMKSIKRYKEIEEENHGLAVETVSKKKNVKNSINADGKCVGKKVIETTITNTKSVMNSIMALEAELTKVQKARTKAIEVLSKYRAEKAKLDNENTGDELVDNWMMAVLGKEAESNE